jgi:magnesium-transporting ATPase (P-type)
MNKTMSIAVLICVFGCSKDAEPEQTYEEYREENKTTNYYPSVKLEKKGYKIDTDGEIIEINLDDLSFGDAFNIQYRAKGEGKTFWWRSNQYTTDLRKE